MPPLQMISKTQSEGTVPDEKGNKEKHGKPSGKPPSKPPKIKNLRVPLFAWYEYRVLVRVWANPSLGTMEITVDGAI